VRAELISILENFIPTCSVPPTPLRRVHPAETRVILQRARELIPEHRQTLEGLPARLSQRDALSQLIQSLDEARCTPRRGAVGAVSGAARRRAAHADRVAAAAQ